MNGYNGITYLDSGNNHYRQRILIGTPTTGTIRMEWHIATRGQVVPPNWSQANAFPFYGGNTIITNRYPVADAQNLIVRHAVLDGYEWLFLHEHDVLLPPNTFIRLNEYMRDGKIPVVSGLTYTRSRPSEPMCYRGRGNSFYGEWEVGDKVWCDGIPTGCLLVHCSILRAMWEESEEYVIGGEKLRRVFNTPVGLWLDPESEAYATWQGTSDLAWCKRVMDEQFFAKAGWADYQEKEWPFLLDTELFCGHISQNGEQFPYANPWSQVPAVKEWQDRLRNATVVEKVS